MISVFIVSGVLISLTMLLCLYRAALGPGVYNRIASVCIIGTKTIVLITIVGHIFGRPSMYVDISLLYAIINFIGILIMVKYLEGRELCS